MTDQGTYRTPGGWLIHSRRGRDGGPIIEIERDDGVMVAVGESALLGAVKVSDDPFWPSPAIVVPSEVVSPD